MIFRLRDILKERQLTVSQFAEMSGLSQSNISNYMNGNISPTLDTLTKISKTLRINITDLFKESEELVLVVKYNDKIIELNKKELLEFVKTKIKSKNI